MKNYRFSRWACIAACAGLLVNVLALTPSLKASTGLYFSTLFISLTVLLLIIDITAKRQAHSKTEDKNSHE